MGERTKAAKQLRDNFADLPDKKQAWDDLHRLTSDTHSDVTVAANHSSGRVSIFRASEADEDGFKKDEAEAEIQKYMKEAKSAVQGSESKEKLLEAVENLGDVLKEIQEKSKALCG